MAATLSAVAHLWRSQVFAAHATVEAAFARFGDEPSLDEVAVSIRRVIAMYDDPGALTKAELSSLSRIVLELSDALQQVIIGLPGTDGLIPLHEELQGTAEDLALSAKYFDKSLPGPPSEDEWEPCPPKT